MLDCFALQLKLDFDRKDFKLPSQVHPGISDYQ